MNTVNKLKSTLLGAAILLAAATPAQAIAIHGDDEGAGASVKSKPVEVSATVPEFIILHYHSSIDMTFDTPSTEAIDEGGNKMNVTWNGVVYNNEEIETSELRDATNLELNNDIVNVSVPNVWAVRGFAPNGKANVRIAFLNGKNKLNREESVIEMSSLEVTEGESSGSDIDVPLRGIAKSRATTGGISMDLDFMKTTLSGKHTGGLYEITATTI